MAFADDFREHVLPRLRDACRLQGIAMAIDDATFSGARSEVHILAHRLGAGFLPESIYDDLLDWITSTLLAELLACESVADELEAEQCADPVSYYERLAIDSADPERMRWTFASISPEYRAHLVAQRTLAPTHAG